MATPAVGASALSRRGLLIAAATALVAACGRGDDEQSGPGPGSTELVIGASLELSGVGAALGVLQERALRITLESVNEEGIPVGNLRRTVRLLLKDNKSDPKLAAQHATELAARDNVHALIGGCLAETSLAIIPVAQEHLVPFISFAAADAIALPLPQRTFVFKLTPDATDVARALARLIRTQGLERVALLAADGPYGDSGVRAITGALTTTGRDLVRVTRLPRGEKANHGPAARLVADLQPEAVVVWATAPGSGAAARALRQAGYTGGIFFDAGAVAEETLSPENVPAVEGAYAVHPSSLNGSSLTNTTTVGLDRRDFVYRYIHQNGSFSGFAPYASDAVRLLSTAARLANSVDRGRLRAYLERQVTDGIAGPYSFAPIRHGGMDPSALAAFTVTRGAWSRVS